MLTEGAKPGTPHITPRKIYPDGIDLFIEVKSSSSLLIVACKIINILRKIYISLQSITLTFSPSSLRFPDNFTPRNAQCFWQWASKIACPQKFFFYAFNFGTKFCNRRRRGCKRLQIAKQKVHFLLMREFSPFVLVTFFRKTPTLKLFHFCSFSTVFSRFPHQEPQAEMFLRIEGFQVTFFRRGKDLNQAAVSPQVEIKEINKTWEHAVFLKNFKLGTNFLLQCWWSVCDILSVTQWQNVKNGQGGLGGWGGERGQGQELLVDLKSKVAVYLKENVFVNCGWVGSFFLGGKTTLFGH